VNQVGGADDRDENGRRRDGGGCLLARGGHRGGPSGKRDRSHDINPAVLGSVYASGGAHRRGGAIAGVQALFESTMCTSH
jgi:hypothetical protein